jgi:hypothetical protein
MQGTVTGLHIDRCRFCKDHRRSRVRLPGLFRRNAFIGRGIRFMRTVRLFGVFAGSAVILISFLF